MKKESEIEKNSDYSDEMKKYQNFSSETNHLSKSLKLLPDHVIKTKLRSAILEILYTRNNNVDNIGLISNPTPSAEILSSSANFEFNKNNALDNFLTKNKDCISISEILNDPKIKEIVNKEKNASNLFDLTFNECLKKEFLIRKEGVFAKEEYYMVNWVVWDNIFKRVSDKLKGLNFHKIVLYFISIFQK